MLITQPILDLKDVSKDGDVTYSTNIFNIKDVIAKYRYNHLAEQEGVTYTYIKNEQCIEPTIYDYVVKGLKLQYNSKSSRGETVHAFKNR